jgi:glutathione S-transferase
MRTLNTVPTANGQHASIALVECGLEHDIHLVDLMAGERRSSRMLELNPVGRMPVLSVYHPAATSVSRLPEGFGDYLHIRRWEERIGQREAIQHGMQASS